MDELYINQSSLESQEKELLLKRFLVGDGIRISFLYDSDFKSAKILRDYIEKICEILKIENKWKSRLILITDELNNNAIEYGSRNDEKNSMRIIVQKTATTCEITIEVEDTGNGVGSKKSQEMEALRKERLALGFKGHASIRGRGLFMIISNLVDTLSFRDSDHGGLVVEVHKKL